MAKVYVSDVQTPNEIHAICGEAITQGDMVAIGSADGKFYKANAITGATQQAPCVGIAEIDGASGDMISAKRVGRVEGAADLTPGQPVYLGETDGAVTATEPSTNGDVVQVVGVAISATSFLLNVIDDYTTATGG